MKTEPACVTNERTKNPCSTCGLEFAQSLYRYAKQKQKNGEVVERYAILRACAKNQKLPVSEDPPEKQLLAEREE